MQLLSRICSNFTLYSTCSSNLKISISNTINFHRLSFEVCVCLNHLRNILVSCLVNLIYYFDELPLSNYMPTNEKTFLLTI